MGLPEPIGVMGLGVLGGSLVRGLAALRPRPEVRGFSPDPAEVQAAAGILEADPGSWTEEAVVEGSRLVIYATPLDVLAGQLARDAARWREDAVVTDVGSLQVPILRAVRDRPGRFVASHPMAGSQASGFQASSAGLFAGRTVWLSSGGADEEARTTVEAFWRALGATPVWIGPGEHDEAMALRSHLPQLAANALAHVLGRGGARPGELGPGGRDMTRLAGSSPAVWIPLLREGGDLLPRHLRALARTLLDRAEELEEGRFEDLRAFMEETRRWTEDR